MKDIFMPLPDKADTGVSGADARPQFNYSGHDVQPLQQSLTYLVDSSAETFGTDKATGKTTAIRAERPMPGGAPR